jgi:alkanesulfonate monooxygenase SsuD/methylene tetrahydromethanopterin reductase-like flavin-dependent oxidoreductase (luciferase family)
MKFGYGFITCQRYPGDPRSDADLYAEALELAEEAEAGGFDSVWVTEHHFVDDAYMSALLPVCAAIAARTSRIDICTGVLLAPLHEPLRVAEDAAVVDLLSRGRFVLGLGQGWREEEFEGLRVPLSERGARMRELITVCREAWSDGLVESRGVSVTPKPARPGGPPIWMGAMNERTVRRAAQLADGFIATMVTPEEFGRQVGWIHDELDRQGRDRSSFTISVTAPTLSWDGGDAWERMRDPFHFYDWKFADMRDARARTGPVVPPPPLSEERAAELRAQALVGRPEEVAEKIALFEDAAGTEIHYIGRLYWPGMDRDVQGEVIRTFAEGVIPALRSRRSGSLDGDAAVAAA